MSERILFLSPFFFPEDISTGKYNTVLVSGLVSRGAHVKVVCSHPLFPAWRVASSNAQLAGVEIVRGGAWMRYPKAVLLRRAALEVWYACFVLREVFFKRNAFDTVVAVFPPSLFFYLLSLLLPKKARLVGIVHDLQGVHIAQANSVAARMIGYAIHAVERRCFSVCDCLIFLSNAMAKRAIAEYALTIERCVVRYPFVALNEPASNERTVGENLKAIFNPDCKHVVYSGGLGDKQNPDALYAFMAALAKRDAGVCCYIFSAGPHFERLKLQYADLGLVRFENLVPEEDVAELYARSDVQIIPQAFGTGDGSLPSKLPNILFAGVPVLAICEAESELGQLVLEARAGAVVNTWQVDALLSSVDRLLNNEVRTHATEQARLKAFVKQKFSLEVLLDTVLLKSQSF